MFASLDVFNMAQAMAQHAGQRQALVAENVAHADTPGYRPRDLPAFSDTFGTGASSLRATRPGHMFGQGAHMPANPVETKSSAAANGNAVTIEDQMLKAVDVKRQHDRALAIYKSSLTILRTSIGRQS